MIVRMLTQLAGPHRSHEIGDEVTFPDSAGQRLIDEGFAENIDFKPATETLERATRKPKAETR